MWGLLVRGLLVGGCWWRVAGGGCWRGVAGGGVAGGGAGAALECKPSCSQRRPLRSFFSAPWEDGR